MVNRLLLPLKYCLSSFIGFSSDRLFLTLLIGSQPCSVVCKKAVQNKILKRFQRHIKSRFFKGGFE